MAIQSRHDVLWHLAEGRGVWMPFCGNTQPATTNAGGTSGRHTLQLFFNRVGTTAPGTLVGFPLPPGLSGSLFGTLAASATSQNSVGQATYLGYLYQIGTLNLAATGDQWTHDSAVFPVTRTQFGVAAQPLTLTPLLYITTATTTTAPAFRLRTNAGGAGYTNQDGTGVVGSTTFTCPAAATAVQSAYSLRLESGDSGVQDISGVNVDTAGSAGAATIFGLEILAMTGGATIGMGGAHDMMLGALGMGDLAPALPTSGTLTSYLVFIASVNQLAASRVGMAFASL